jgi:hypothetical protein
MAEVTMTGARNPSSRQRAAPYIFHHTSVAMRRIIAGQAEYYVE